MDPAYAKKLGVNIDELYISQPDNGEQALEICEAMVRSFAIDIVVVDSVAALVGQSGVGKSSLVRQLVPQSEAQIGELDRDEEGRHTTTTSRLFDLPRGGHLIDSPGVRDFAPAIDRLDSRTLGFAEVERLAPGCRFQDCQHMREPGCAVQKAAENGELDARRYESYRRMRRLYDDLVKARGPKSRPRN
jgi:ribosome small subunit-dependent GTPase A